MAESNNIYDDVRNILVGLKLKEAKEYFDLENIPDSLADNSFVISPFELSEGNNISTSQSVKIIGIIAGIKIYLSFKLPANRIINKMKTSSTIVENVIKGILGITVGEDEKDLFAFAGSNPLVEGDKLIYEINFNASYRIKNY